MYKILIADDEPLVSIGMKTLLSHNNPAFDDLDITGTASNGQKAFDMIVQQRPDIVISDIKMPVMDGLELLEKCRQQFGHIPAFIMLTAFEEFEMARKAVSLQAVDYLVKIELNEENLASALTKAKAAVDEHRPETHPATSIDISEDFRQKFLLRLLTGAINERLIASEAEALDINLNYDRFIAVYCQTLPSAGNDNLESSSEKAKRLELTASCMEMARTIISRYLHCLFASVSADSFAMLFCFSCDDPVAEMTNNIMEAVQNAHSMVMNYFNTSLLFGIGSAVSSASGIHSGYEEAVTAARAADESCPVRIFSHIVGANRRSGKDRLISSIQDYVDHNMNGKLQLSEVAEVFGLSPAYLSVLFKKNMDTGFSEYVASRKIEKAKSLLLTTDMKIYEVADATGFESAFYFSKVFKKIEGVSPREFLQLKKG
jgi:two-component system response regulator YesN